MSLVLKIKILFVTEDNSLRIWEATERRIRQGDTEHQKEHILQLLYYCNNVDLHTTVTMS